MCHHLFRRGSKNTLDTSIFVLDSAFHTIFFVSEEEWEKSTGHRCVCNCGWFFRLGAQLIRYLTASNGSFLEIAWNSCVLECFLSEMQNKLYETEANLQITCFEPIWKYFDSKWITVIKFGLIWYLRVIKILSINPAGADYTAIAVGVKLMCFFPEKFEPSNC